MKKFEVNVFIMRAINYITVGAFIVLSGCATAPPISDAASQVQIIDPFQARACTYIRQVNYIDRILGLGKDPTVMDAIGVASLRNLVAAAGGNSVVIIHRESSWATGSINWEGKAYQCQLP